MTQSELTSQEPENVLQEEPDVQAAPSIPDDQFDPILVQLQSPQKFLPAAPTFVPQSFQEQIQFVFDGTNYSLYFYANNTWQKLSPGGAAASGINGRSHNSTTQAIPVSSGTSVILLTLDTNDFAHGITWDATNHQFVCVTPGVYSIFCSVQFDPTAFFNGDTYSAIIKKNTTIVARQDATAGLQAIGGTFFVGCSDLVTLLAGDTISFYLMVGDNSAMTITSASGAIAKV